MIHHLSGIHETADYRTDTQICLYYNDENENYPPHWHTPFEVIMPVKNIYTVDVGEKHYVLREGDILVICPGIVHELFAPETGERIIFQPGLSQVQIRELELLISLIRPAVLITPEKYPTFHQTAHQLMLEIKEEYFRCEPYYEIMHIFQFPFTLVRKKKSTFADFFFQLSEVLLNPFCLAVFYLNC